MGILRDKARKRGLKVQVDSAGTESYHAGEGADPRSLQIAAKYGIDISDHIARQFRVTDFDTYDRIYVMDSNNHEEMIGVIRNGSDRARVDYIMNLSHPGLDLPVPDPYYGGRDGFENVYHMLDRACDVLIEDIESSLRPGQDPSHIKET
jgi:protein-tyrosine phosphatase